MINLLCINCCIDLREKKESLINTHFKAFFSATKKTFFFKSSVLSSILSCVYINPQKVSADKDSDIFLEILDKFFSSNFFFSTIKNCQSRIYETVFEK